MRKHVFSILLLLLLGSSSLVAAPISVAEGDASSLGAVLPLWSIIPFVGILLSIAIFPLVAEVVIEEDVEVEDAGHPQEGNENLPHGVHMKIESVVRDLFLIGMGLASLKMTPKAYREGNEFTWFPIKESGQTFCRNFYHNRACSGDTQGRRVRFAQIRNRCGLLWCDDLH